MVNVSTSVPSVFLGKHSVIGIGTKPDVPDCIKEVKSPNIFHSSDYLLKKAILQPGSKVTIVGSDQSAVVDANNSIFVQNAELHIHGFNSADLGMGPYRNEIILNSILAFEYFKTETKVAFQTFGLPDTDALI